MKKYLVPADIDLEARKLSIKEIIQMIKFGDVILDKTYRKRRDNEWNQNKKSCLIESIMLRIPIGRFYFEMNKDKKYIVIDGWQRLSSLNKFIEMNDNKEIFYLSELKYMEKFEEHYWKELPVYIRRRILDQNLDVYILNSRVPEDIKEDLSIRMS